MVGIGPKKQLVASRDMVGTFRDIRGNSRPSHDVDAAERPVSRRLDTWKEIASFIGRDERTAKRWEATRGLPVHRPPGGGRSKVYAYTDEVWRWMHEIAELEPPPVESASDAESGSDLVKAQPRSVDGLGILARRRRWPLRAALTLGLACAVVIGLVAVIGTALRPSPPVKVNADADKDAAEFYRAGLHDWSTRTPEGLHTALDEFTQSIIRDPNYAPAYAGLANCYNLLREYTDMPASEAYPRAKQAALRALQLDDHLASAHVALGFEEFYWEWKAPQALGEFDRALSIDPNSALGHHWYANVLLHMGRIADAQKEIIQAEQIDPTDTSVLSDKGLILFYGGQLQEASDLLLRMERTTPEHLSPHRYLAELYFAENDFDDYLNEQHLIASMRQDDALKQIADRASEGWRTGGRQGLLKATLAAQLSLLSRGLSTNYEVARSLARLGDQSQAMQYLKVSLERREPQFMAVRIDPALASLRALEGFPALAAGIVKG